MASSRPARRSSALLLPWLLLLHAPASLAQERPAAEWWANANVGSYHFGDADGHLPPGEDFNEFNPGVGVEVQWRPVHAVSAGYFRNSVDEDSLYLLYHFTPIALGRHVRVGALGGLVAKLERGRFGANLILLPPLEDVTPATIGLQLKYRFR